MLTQSCAKSDMPFAMCPQYNTPKCACKHNSARKIKSVKIKQKRQFSHPAKIDVFVNYIQRMKNGPLGTGLVVHFPPMHFPPIHFPPLSNSPVTAISFSCSTGLLIYSANPSSRYEERMPTIAFAVSTTTGVS